MYHAIWQAFAVLLPVQTVGVKGDERSYERLRAARGQLARRHDRGLDALRHGVLGRAASRIVNQIRGINRVVYDSTSKAPGTIEWE